MKLKLKQIAEDNYEAGSSLLRFLIRCYLRFDSDSKQLKFDLTDDDIVSLVDWWKKQQTEQKEYYLVVNPDALKIYGSEFPEYVNQIEDTSDHFTFHYGVPTRYSEAELETIKQAHPTLAPAIEAMKTPVEDDEC